MSIKREIFSSQSNRPIQSQERQRPLLFKYQPESFIAAQQNIETIVELAWHEIYLQQLDAFKLPFSIQSSFQLVSLNADNHLRKYDNVDKMNVDDEDTVEPTPCPQDQWCGSLMRYNIRYIQKTDSAPTLLLPIKKSSRSTRTGSETSPRSPRLAWLRSRENKRQMNKQALKFIKLEDLNEQSHDLEEQLIDKLVEKARQTKAKQEIKNIREKSQPQKINSGHAQKRRNRLLSIGSASSIGSFDKDEKKNEQKFTTDYYGHKINCESPNLDPMKDVKSSYKIIKSEQEIAFLEQLKKKKRIRSEINIQRSKKTIFEQFKEQLKGKKTLENQDVSVIFGSNTNNQNYVKPLPPSQILDLQAGVKLKDRHNLKNGGEFTMTMRGQMSREEYFGHNRSHKIIPPLTARQLNKKQQKSESNRLSDEEKNPKESEINQQRPQTRYLQDTLSTIYGDSNAALGKLKMRKIMGEKIVMTKRRDQVQDLLQIDENQLWNQNRLKALKNPTVVDSDEFKAQTPRVNALNLHTPRSNQITPLDIQSTAPYTLASTPRYTDRVFYDTQQIKSRQEELERAKILAHACFSSQTPRNGLTPKLKLQQLTSAVNKQRERHQMISQQGNKKSGLLLRDSQY